MRPFLCTDLLICNRVEARLAKVTHPKARKLNDDERKGEAAEVAVFISRKQQLVGRAKSLRLSSFN